MGIKGKLKKWWKEEQEKRKLYREAYKKAEEKEIKKKAKRKAKEKYNPPKFKPAKKTKAPGRKSSWFSYGGIEFNPVGGLPDLTQPRRKKKRKRKKEPEFQIFRF